MKTTKTNWKLAATAIALMMQTISMGSIIGRTANSSMSNSGTMAGRLRFSQGLSNSGTMIAGTYNRERRW